MKRIKLTQGKYALVDDDDYEWLNRYSWYADEHNHTWYARTMINGKQVRMHRLILGFPNMDIDHKDRNGLNNQRSNLSACRHSVNMARKVKRQGSTSQYRGVSWDKKKQNWVLRLSISTGKYQFIGNFDSERYAALAYDLWAIDIYNTKFTVKDTNGNKYNFREKKADGTQTKAFLHFSQLGVKQGGTYEITYAENDKEYMGRPYKDRIILGFKPTSGSPTTLPAKSPVSEANRPLKNDSVDWDKLGLIKAYHNLIAAYIAKGETRDQLLQHINDGSLWLICKTIEEDVEKRSATGWKRAEAMFKRDEPPIESFVESPITDSEVEGIPF
jgi:hypothetical protein